MFEMSSRIVKGVYQYPVPLGFGTSDKCSVKIQNPHFSKSCPLSLDAFSGSFYLLSCEQSGATIQMHVCIDKKPKLTFQFNIPQVIPKTKKGQTFLDNRTHCSETICPNVSSNYKKFCFVDSLDFAPIMLKSVQILSVTMTVPDCARICCIEAQPLVGCGVQTCPNAVAKNNQCNFLHDHRKKKGIEGHLFIEY